MALVADVWEQWRPNATITCITSSPRYVCVALEYTDCVVLKLWRSSEKPTTAFAFTPHTSQELTGHAERIVCAAFQGDVLCTVSSDCILVWRISVVDDKFSVTRYMLVPSPRCLVTAIEFDASGGLVALAYHTQVEIVTVQLKEVFVTLEGHLAKITAIRFDSLQPHVLITASEDRTFKVWDLADQSLRYQSAVLSAHSILALAVNPLTSDICVGFADGTVRIFHQYSTELVSLAVGATISKLDKHHQITALVNQTLATTQNVVSSLPPWARSQNATTSAAARTLLAQTNSALSSSCTTTTANLTLAALQAELDPDGHMVEVPCTILGMHYVVAPSEVSPETALLPSMRPVLMIGTTNHLVAVDALSYEMSVVHSFQAEHPVVVGVASHTAMANVLKDQRGHEERPGVVDIWIASAFQPCVTRLQAQLSRGPLVPAVDELANGATSAEAGDGRTTLSMVPQSAPPPTSILCLSPLQLQDVAPPSKSSKRDQPVTFHTRIKSSGYGPTDSKKKPSASLKFQRLKTRPPSSQSTNQLNDDSPISPPPLLPSYPIACNRVSRLDPTKTKLKWHRGCVNRIEYSADGAGFASAGNDRLAQVTFSKSSKPFKPTPTGQPIVLMGHEHYVRTVRWSHSGRYLLTTSADRTARIWGVPSDAASLTIPSAAASSRAPGLDITDAAFYYMDKFVVVAMANKIKIFQYVVDDRHVHHVKTTDVARLENHSKAKVVAAYNLDSIKAVTSIACANSSLSHLLVAAASDKSVRVVDVAVSKTVRVIPAAHATRAAHTVVVPQASPYVAHSPDVYNLVLSAACDNAMHLWDVRADNCVLRFGEHTNRVHAVGAAFSPCLRYVAAGSEAKVTHLYDLRTGRTLDKLHGHTDVVTAIAFHPVKPWLATGAADGSIKYYGPADD
ncbi:hypothetical protein, variant [Aphanomyces invadans]|uniref:Anaphase-promoting complex subunit 4 WD40 domain-containing protein n=1 Tax=Aphanomyces invadans TaxID=157072 RepID=A0A024U1B3_9STRA|nr:hypothetical protein, variant [Aphanomyces invadans]ETV99691.1 hypothetical protein, variant [Aphanomyces invadans]|eukprot:XP_008871467.1 hypothetical protein, variant [Aphanomyces invadans]